MTIWRNLANAMVVPELRNRILFVFGAFAAFVLAVYVQVPFVNITQWQSLINSGQFLQFIGFLSGGALQNFSVIAMGITPYINASIIMQLMTVVLPQLEELAKNQGMLTLRHDGFRKVREGITTIEEVFQVAGESRLTANEI